MKDELREYMRRLDAELEDLSGHIGTLIDCCEHSRTAHELTEHVCLENVAVLKNEQCGIRRFREELGKLDFSGCANLDELADKVRSTFTMDVEHCGFAPCTLVFAERKMMKVRNQMEDASHD